MIYVEEDDLKLQLKLLEYFSGRERFTVIGWQNPEINKSTVPFLPSNATRGSYEPVTTYSNGIIANHTVPTQAKPSMLAYLFKFRQEIQNTFDSICLYRFGSSEWFACTIGHEGMCLVRDDTFLKDLKIKGFNASINKPDWW